MRITVVVSSIAEVSEDDSISLKSPATKGKKKSFSSLKAKSKANASANGENSGVHKPGRKIKSSHNLIEKKYRTNINSKIIDLRNCVPALRIVISKNRGHRTSTVNEGGEEQFDDDYEGNGYSDDERKLDGLKPAKKLNKATILSKATEYIRHLEYKNQVLMEENAKLRSIVENTNSSIESILSNQQQPQQMKHTAPVYYNHNDSLSPDSNSPFSNSGSGSTHISPRTMMDRSPTSLPMQQPMRSQSLQSPTSQQAQQQQQQQAQQQTQLPTPQTQQSSLSQKLMMGGMACMIGSTAFDDFNSGSPGSGGHRSGLFSIPVFAFSTSTSPLTGTSSISSSLMRPFFGLLKLILCFTVLYQYFLIPILSSFEFVDENDEKDGKVRTRTAAGQSQMSATEVAEKLMSVCLDPIGAYNQISSVSVSAVERFVVGKLSLSPEHQYTGATVVSSSKLYTMLFKTLNLKNSAYNCFLKALLLKKISELNAERADELSCSYSFLIYATIANKLMIDRLGHFFWRLGRLSLDSTRESRGLKDLLQNYSYREVDCNSLAAYKNSSSVPCDSLSNLVTISLVDKRIR
ncbi:unnamed protein product [Ambrosiozyma monospora]|uniref:Unnamed protein product n=1 Tax=Ambrosiozyma monospora TaxID=43982 RepID=A0ACB5TQC9_AMBMO|nr:unnamed protein product [Ambrosiozyma monospora]